jgi:toxin ParE1/3/4
VTVRLTSEVEADLAEARQWYLRQGPHLARGFVRSVDAGLALIERHPDGHPIVYRAVRRVLLHRFPYALFYARDGGILVVLGCFHTARDPATWQERSDAFLD